MKKYKNRTSRKIRKIAKVACLTTAILWGVSSIVFTSRDEKLKKEYYSEQITHTEFLQTTMKFNKQEETVFTVLYSLLLTSFVADVVCANDKEE